MDPIQNKRKRRDPSRRRDSQETKRRLLEAAMSLFSDVGYDATTTKLIAKKAKVNEALIHRYFESKAGLLIALFHHIKANGDQSLLDLPIAGSLEEELFQFFQLRSKIARDQHKEIRLILSRAMVDSELAEEMGKKVCGTGMPGLTERLTEWRAKGEVHPAIDLDQASLGISGYAFMSAFFGQILFGLDGPTFEQGLREMAKIFACGLKQNRVPQ